MGLVRRELIRAERSTLPGQEMYRFRHLLIRDAAYEGMPKELRAELHERFADWLEQIAGERIDEQQEILAYHLEQTVELRRQLGPLGEREIEISRRAALHLRASGDRARDRGDLRAAEHLYGRATDLQPEDDPTYPDLLYELGRVLSVTERRKEAVELLQRARDLARRRRDLRTDWLSRLALSTTLMSVDPHAVITSRFREEIQEAIGHRIRRFGRKRHNDRIDSVTIQVAHDVQELRRWPGTAQDRDEVDDSYNAFTAR